MWEAARGRRRHAEPWLRARRESHGGVGDWIEGEEMKMELEQGWAPHMSRFSSSR
jgi:hypothetical protein